MTWSFIGTDGSVPLCSLFHAIFNTWSLALLTGASAHALLALETAALIVVTLFLAIRYGSSLSPHPSTRTDGTSAANKKPSAQHS